MSFKKDYLNYLKEIQLFYNILLEYIENQSNSEIDIQNIQKYIDDHKIHENKQKLKEILRLIVQIANHHHRTPDFFDKIEKILLILKESIQNHFSINDTVNIFSKNSRIFLFLIEQKIILLDQLTSINMDLYIQNFESLLNFQSYLKSIESSEISAEEQQEKFEIYQANRKTGENDDFICKLIRNDSIEEFVAFVTKNNYSLTANIKNSIFETNKFLLKNQVNLIEYSVFFGSIQIFNYLKLNNVELNPSLWFFAIHGKNPEIIHIFEENNVKPPNNDYKKCFYESMKCHHIEFSKYFQNNYLVHSRCENDFENCVNALKYRNYAFFPNELKSEFNFLHLAAKYDYIDIFNIIMNPQKVDVNLKIVFDLFFYSCNFKYFFFCLI